MLTQRGFNIMSTTDQKIALLQQQINRLRDNKRKEEASRKIIVGGMMMSLARKDKAIANQLLNFLEKNITREADKKRIQPLIDELKSN